MTTLLLVLKKIESEDKTKHNNLYSSSKAEITVNESATDVFQSIYTTIITYKNNQKKVQAGFLIQSLIILVFQSIILQLEAVILNYQKNQIIQEKDLIDVQNTDDNKCFQWCLIRHLNPTDNNPRRITKADKEMQRNLILKA